MTYLSGVENLIELKKQYPQYEMVLHSDQGAVYASKAFNELLLMYGISRSMSRAGTPTDNAAMEAINGWIKAEIFMDFHVTGESPVEEEVTAYITFFNTLSSQTRVYHEIYDVEQEIHFYCRKI